MKPQKQNGKQTFSTVNLNASYKPPRAQQGSFCFLPFVVLAISIASYFSNSLAATLPPQAFLAHSLEPVEDQEEETYLQE